MLCVPVSLSVHTSHLVPGTNYKREGLTVAKSGTNTNSAKEWDT